MNWPRTLLVALFAGMVMFGLAVVVDLLLEDVLGATALRACRAAVLGASMLVIIVLTRSFWMKAGER